MYKGYCYLYIIIDNKPTIKRFPFNGFYLQRGHCYDISTNSTKPHSQNNMLMQISTLICLIGLVMQANGLFCVFV